MPRDQEIPLALWVGLRPLGRGRQSGHRPTVLCVASIRQAPSNGRIAVGRLQFGDCHDPKDRMRQGYEPASGQDLKGLGSRVARPDAHIPHLSPTKKSKGRNQNFSGTRSTPGGIETSLPRAQVLEPMTTLLHTCVRGYWARYLSIFCRGPTPITPLFAGRRRCQPPIMLVL